MTLHRILCPLVLGLALAGPAAAGHDNPAGIRGEIRQELAEARREVRVDLAKARRELETGNLRLDDSLVIGKRRDTPALPRAEITPQGDLLIEGRAQPIEPSQRRALLAYRGQVIAVAQAGIDIGQRSAEAALAAVDVPFASLLFGAVSGGLERRIERTVAREVEPAVRGLCRQLPALRETQQQLAASVPQFRPYANLRQDEVDDCHRLGRDAFATR